MNTMARASAPRASSARAISLTSVRIDLLPDGPVRHSALADFEAQVAVDDRHEVAPESPGLPAIATAHLEHVTEPACRDEADARAFAFEQRIGAHRRAVHDRAELRERPEGLQAFEEPDGFVAAVRRDFRSTKPGCILVVIEQVREGPAYVHADDLPHDGVHAAAPFLRATVALSSTSPLSLTTTP